MTDPPPVSKGDQGAVPIKSGVRSHRLISFASMTKNRGSLISRNEMAITNEAFAFPLFPLFLQCPEMVLAVHKFWSLLNSKRSRKTFLLHVGQFRKLQSFGSFHFVGSSDSKIPLERCGADVMPSLLVDSGNCTLFPTLKHYLLQSRSV